MDYIKWMKNEQNVSITAKERDYYSLVSNAVLEGFKKSKFWCDLLTNINKYDQEYQVITGYNLVIPNFVPELKIKPFKSFLEKTYRKNILDNDAFPEAPEDGWVVPKNWFTRINDIVRTMFVVKYFDGVKFLVSKIEALSKNHDLNLLVDYEAREEGYYAAHLCIRQEFEIPHELWDTIRANIAVELQITTQFQEVIRKLLRKYYEKKRIAIMKPTEKWQWDSGCDEFCTNYLGHILHYIEGTIVEIRDKQKEEKR